MVHSTRRFHDGDLFLGAVIDVVVGVVADRHPDPRPRLPCDALEPLKEIGAQQQVGAINCGEGRLVAAVVDEVASPHPAHEAGPVPIAEAESADARRRYQPECHDEGEGGDEQERWLTKAGNSYAFLTQSD
ncbi:hypothetical protein PSA01_31760 [Pseudonocardia saturnea]|uniref:Uncharacterized protein n=1 Tax=Pseudonocardia saturnea TaxID=33909 RepID=A0ABQ0RZQ1_9PSEU|nr:hypothetical protein Pdca_40370 [Pseudonocardia autotrophica]GEC26147.1 hypothetical protein PSA01_31760 [Pseudonocardia saturnea]